MTHLYIFVDVPTPGNAGGASLRDTAAKLICSENLHHACMCHVPNLVVTRGPANVSVPCGSSQRHQDMVDLPNIRPPTGVNLPPVSLCL